MYQAVTHSIRVSVNPIYLEDQSSPLDDHYVWAYQVEIENQGEDVVQLLTRYWKITDALGRVQEVRGPGVVGEQPQLGPGEHFEYTSGCPLHTPYGSMEGTFEMVRADGSKFDAQVARFELREPGGIH